MLKLDITNNLKNADFFRRYVRGARFNRGLNIPNKNIINFNVEKNPIKVIADIQGSGNSRYVINIIQDENGFKIIHDCPDFKKGFSFCKHIVKILLILDTELCRIICQNISKITFTSNFNLIKESKIESFIIKAEDLIKQSKYYEAISFLNQAFEQSRNFEYIKKIGEVALKYKLYDLFLKYAVRFKELSNKYLNDFPKVISSALVHLKDYNFSKKVEILIDVQDLLVNFPKNLLIDTLKQIDINKIDNPVLKYLLLHRMASVIYVDDYFKDILINPKVSIKDQIAKLTLDLFDEAILNMESEEEVYVFVTIAKFCKFNNYNSLLPKFQEYKKKLHDMYREGLKLKHAFLRSLVIANTETDKLRQLQFTEKYNYPSLIWATPYRSESPLYYYVLEKCGFERHHLEYINMRDFIENYPVFAEIFSGNNPARYGIKEFWGTKKPRIINIVENDPMIELEFELNLQDLENFILIEWDLAQKPILGSYICQFSDGFLIPDKTHPLTHEIQPFDLLLCDKRPIAIKGSNIKIIRPLRRISIKTAIELAWAGIEYIVSYLPLEIIDDLKNYRIDELDAIDKIHETFKTYFLPNKDNSKTHFHRFIHQKVIRELNNAYLKVKNKPNHSQKVLRMIGFHRYSQIFKKRTVLQPFRVSDLKRNSLKELKLDLKKFVSNKLTELIKDKDFESINLKILKKYSTFKKWTIRIIHDLKEQLEKSKIYKVGKDIYDIHEISHNYYGKIIIKEIMNNITIKNEREGTQRALISKDKLNHMLENFKFLKLTSPKIIENLS